MSTTPFKIYGKQTDFTYFPGEHSIKIHKNVPEKVINSSIVQEGYEKAGKILSLVSNRRKIFVSPPGAFFHTFADTVAPLVQQYKLDPDVDIIIDVSTISNPMLTTGGVEFSEKSFTGFFIKALQDAGASVYTVDRNSYDAININNFYINDYGFTVGDTYTDLYELFSNYADKPAVPTKYVYLSRKRIPSRIEVVQNSIDKELVSNYNRSDNEQYIEDYFFSLGYEIICPEDFKTFEEQIRYMYNVKTLVSLSGSGLTNCIFMQPGQNVVEIVTPLAIPFENTDNPYNSLLIEDLHHFYSVIAFKKKHTYLAIENQNKGSIEIVDKINSDPKLKRFLQNEKFKRTNPYGWFRKSIR